MVPLILTAFSSHFFQVDSKEAVSKVLSGVKPQTKKSEKKAEKPKEKEKSDKAPEKGKKGVMPLFFSSSYLKL